VHWWLSSITLATWEAESRKIVVLGQPGQGVLKIPSQPIAGHRAQACHPKLHGLRLEGSSFQINNGKKSLQIPSKQKKLGHGSMHLSIYYITWKKRIMVRTGLGKKCDLIRKIIKAQRSGAMAQAVENLPEFSSTKKKKSCLNQVVLVFHRQKY
jgi:hypothetical protein